MSLQFTKMQALGNDFVVIDAVNQAVHLSAQQIRLIADRHRGVGCDQVLMLTPANNPNADFGYRIFNADGGEVYQCGNGARCMGLFIQQKKLSDKKKIVLATARDLLNVVCLNDNLVQADIAKPNFEPASLPFIPSAYTATGLQFHVVSVGNPHCVIFFNPTTTDEMMRIGQMLNAHPAFPEGVNIEFVTVLSKNKIMLTVYERGVGLTLACGSGACAAVAVGKKLGQLDSEVMVQQPGGELTVIWASNDSPIQLRGEAHIVFDGVMDPRIAHFPE